MESPSLILDGAQNAAVFRGLTDEDYRMVISSGLRKKVPHQGILFHQGDAATHCYLVKKGLLKLTKLSDQGKEVIIRYIGAGELTAAVAVMKNGFYPVSSEAIQETIVIGWDKPTMVKSMRRFPDVAINLLDLILSRIEDVQQRYLEVCTEQVNQRIARSLLRLMRWAGTTQENGILIDIALSRQNIADYAGTTLYTVSRTLSAWEKKGWIKSERKKILVTNPHALVAFAG